MSTPVRITSARNFGRPGTSLRPASGRRHSFRRCVIDLFQAQPGGFDAVAVETVQLVLHAREDAGGAAGADQLNFSGGATGLAPQGGINLGPDLGLQE